MCVGGAGSAVIDRIYILPLEVPYTAYRIIVYVGGLITILFEYLLAWGFTASTA